MPFAVKKEIISFTITHTLVITGQSALAQEIVQEVFLNLPSLAKKFRPKGRGEFYLLKIAKYLAKNAIKKLKQPI